MNSSSQSNDSMILGFFTDAFLQLCTTGMHSDFKSDKLRVRHKISTASLTSVPEKHCCFVHTIIID